MSSTPEKTYLIEQSVIKDGGMTLLDYKQSLQYYDFTSCKFVPLFSEEEMKRRREVPLIGSLMHFHFMYLYKKLSKNNCLEVLNHAEEELANYIETGEGELTSPVLTWFKGHYSSEEKRNEAGLVMHLLEKVGRCYNERS